MLSCLSCCSLAGCSVVGLRIDVAGADELCLGMVSLLCGVLQEDAWLPGLFGGLSG